MLTYPRDSEQLKVLSFYASRNLLKYFAKFSTIFQINLRTEKFSKANDAFCDYLGYSQTEYEIIRKNGSCSS